MGSVSSGKLHLICNKGVKAVVRWLGVTELNRGRIGVPKMGKIIKGVTSSRWCYLTFLVLGPFLWVCWIMTPMICFSILFFCWEHGLGSSTIVSEIRLDSLHTFSKYLSRAWNMPDSWWGAGDMKIYKVTFLPSKNSDVCIDCSSCSNSGLLTTINLLAKVLPFAFRESLATPPMGRYGKS